MSLENNLLEGEVRGAKPENFPSHYKKPAFEDRPDTLWGRVKKSMHDQFRGGSEALPDSFRMSMILGSIVAYNDLSSNIWYTAMRQTYYGCDYDEMNEKLYFVWMFIQTPIGVVAGWIADLSHHRAHYLLAFTVMSTLLFHWLSFVVYDAAVLEGIYYIWSILTTLLSLLQFKILKQRCDVYYGSEDIVRQDKEANRLAPLSDITGSSMELVLYLMMWFLFQMKNTHFARLMLYIFHAGILMIPLVAMGYRSKDLFVPRTHQHNERAKFEFSGLHRKALQVWHYFVNSVKGILVCKVALHCLLRNFLFKSASNIIQFPVSLTSANSWQDDERVGLDCGGSIANLFLVGLFTQLWYIIGAVVYLFTLSGMVPLKYYRKAYPIVGLATIICCGVLLLRINVFLNSILTGLIIVLLYFVYEFDMVLGLAAVPEAYFGFYNGLVYVAIGLAQGPYPIFASLGIDENVPLMVGIVMGIVAFAILHSLYISRSCAEELNHTLDDDAHDMEEREPGQSEVGVLEKPYDQKL